MSDLIERQAVLRMLDVHHQETGWRFPALRNNITRIPAATVTGTQPSIDWSHVHPDFNWVARDANGKAWFHKSKPETTAAHWDSRHDSFHKADAFASYTPGTCDWRDSLIMRPGHVEGDE